MRDRPMWIVARRLPLAVYERMVSKNLNLKRVLTLAALAFAFFIIILLFAARALR